MNRRRLLALAPLLFAPRAEASSKSVPEVTLDALAQFYNAVYSWKEVPAHVYVHHKAFRTLIELFGLEDLPEVETPWGGLLCSSTATYWEVRITSEQPWIHPSTYVFSWEDEMFTRTHTSPEDEDTTNWYALRDVL